MKTLKDTILEYVVLNMDLLFPSGDLTLKVEESLDRVPQFPPYLFDEILEKSDNMGWIIKPEYLSPCIGIRTKLQWSNIGYFTRECSLSIRDLRLIARESPAPQSLDLWIDAVKPEDMMVFDWLADGLERLRLQINGREMSDGEVLSRPMGTSSRTLKLRCLAFRGHVDTFFLTPDRQTLTSLELDDSILSRPFLAVLADFKELTCLSLYRVTLQGLTIEDLVDSVVNLTRLGYLDLSEVGIFPNSTSEPLDHSTLYDIVSSLKYLEVLAISGVNEFSDAVETPARKLKHLLTASNSREKLTSLERYSCNVYNVHRVEDVLSMYKVITSANHRTMLVWYLIRHLSDNTKNRRPEIFKAIEDLPLNINVLKDMLLYTRDGSLYPNLSVNYVLKLASLFFSVFYTGREQIRNYKLEFQSLIKFAKNFIKSGRTFLTRRFRSVIAENKL